MAHRYRLYPTPEQAQLCERHCADARFVWNAALEQLNAWRAGRPSSSGNAERNRQLAEARQALPFLAQGSSSVQQQALRDFDTACRNWWAGSHRRPRWRKRGLNEGFCVRDVAVRKLNHRWCEITVPKAGRVRLKLSRPLPAKELSMARITLDGKGRWHICIQGPQPALPRTSTGLEVGVDRGVANTLALSDGRMLRCPVMRAAERRRLSRLQRRVAAQRRGSRRRDHTKRQIAAVHQGVRDRRKNWIEVQSTRLVRECDLIAIEDLPVKNMVRRPAPKPDPDREGAFLANGAAAKTGLNRSILAQGWSLWSRRLQEKATASGVTVHSVAPHHTSQSCNACGHTSAESRESQAVFHCCACGHEEHADINAAKNILARALVPAPTPGQGASRTGSAARASRRNGAARTTREELAHVA